jgi:hypothetical protein
LNVITPQIDYFVEHHLELDKKQDFSSNRAIKNEFSDKKQPLRSPLKFTPKEN